ncbi:DUF4261 domain-containing protein [Tuwongella immobilis]|uniref:Uncharacterized protein n=1 Tax=Tuwongella immobilis TaxID=692036 RepID=A0A6C2YN49_9BACT|nr:DUF4261 domain-containing protein [Tuwongella immobilis]VIP02866.1 Uncharacterized protein OS=Achromobacter piechaudii ATCC 43553 GN=HMPREF0004_0979 PE=4 SV=1 [Tuwongella immobilis]VTS02686.1 Uncharacterized protein OS=Achromobacter piechaudii ATCC 43553 GN=HMPREF0004_0979 PE=4 SV=1 [Tuwongella immobilis]
MDLIARYFGDRTQAEPGQLVANPDVENPLSFQLLFPESLDLDADGLTLAMRTYHPDLARAQVEIDTLQDPQAAESVAEIIPNSPVSPGLIGLAGWDQHVVQIIGINAPIPEAVLEATVAPGHYPQELKALAAEHQSHVLLFYAGYDPDPVEQYVALGVVSAALARFGAILILNEAARASIPAGMIAPDEGDEDLLALLRDLPIPLLYGGFVKMEDDEEPGVWMRTFGNPLMGLPDLAHRAPSHEQGSFVFDLFTNVLDYLRKSGKQFAPGDRLTLGDDVEMEVRLAREDEPFLLSMGEMFVLEMRLKSRDAT